MGNQKINAAFLLACSLAGMSLGLASLFAFAMSYTNQTISPLIGLLAGALGALGVPTNWRNFRAAFGL